MEEALSGREGAQVPSLSAVDLGARLSKSEYRSRMPALQERLHLLQRGCWEDGYGTLVLFEGWDLSGKGDCINKLTQRLEPRVFDVHMIYGARTFHQRMPWLWRFWTKLPAYGEFGIFQHSWYRRVLQARLHREVRRGQWERAFHDIRRLEEMLLADRYHVVKIFLHISQQEQHRRLEALSSAPEGSWRIEEDDWREHRLYDEHRRLIERAFRETHTEISPWTVISATDRRWARVGVFETVIDALERGLRSRGMVVPVSLSAPDEADDRYLDEEACARDG